MAKDKDKKEKAVSIIPDGFKCYQKINGGSWRPNSSRIIKPGQKFWISPDVIPATFADAFKEVAADYKAVIVSTNSQVKFIKNEDIEVAEKFEVVIATDENGEVIKKGKDSLYNVIDESGKPMNDKPLRKGKADELFEALKV